MADASPARGSVWLVVGFGAGAAIGWWGASLVGAAIGAIAGTVVATIAVAGARARKTGHALDGPVPDVRDLPPEQARALLGVAMSAGALPPLESEQERAVAEVRALADRDPAQAITLCETLADRFPRSAIVHAELARRRLALPDRPRAEESASLAIGFALDGGSNRLAARLYLELADLHDDLSLPEEKWQRLAGALEALGDEEAAKSCRAAAARAD